MHPSQRTRFWGTLFVLFSLLTAAHSAFSQTPDTGTLLRYNEPGKFIPELQWDSRTVRVEPGSPPTAELSGTFSKPGWQLFVNSGQVLPPARASNKFYARVPLTSATTPIRVIAVGPNREQESEWIWIRQGGATAQAPVAARPTMPARSRTTARRESGGSGQGWLLLGHLGEALSVSTIDNQDKGLRTSVNAWVATFGADLRWWTYAPKWSFSITANAEEYYQSILNESFFLPRSFLRFSYLFRDTDWSYGPLFQFQIGKSAILLSNDAGTAVTKAIVVRKGVGAGGSLSYKVSHQVSLVGMAMLRYDTGGQAAELPSTLSNSLGYEASFGATIASSSGWVYEPRLRYREENFSWASATAGLPASTMQTHLVVLELSVGKVL